MKLGSRPPFPGPPSSGSWARSLGQVCVLGSPRRDAASVRPHGLRLVRVDSDSPSPSLPRLPPAVGSEPQRQLCTGH